MSKANGAWAGLSFATRAPSESGSAAFCGRRHVLDRDVLRMRLVQADVLVVAMMPIMLVIAAHPGIGVQRLRFAFGLDDGCRRGLVHRSLDGLVRWSLRGLAG